MTKEAQAIIFILIQDGMVPQLQHEPPLGSSRGPCGHPKPRKLLTQIQKYSLLGCDVNSRMRAIGYS
jgi:hypothetical protein